MNILNIIATICIFVAFATPVVALIYVVFKKSMSIFEKIFTLFQAIATALALFVIALAIGLRNGFGPS